MDMDMDMDNDTISNTPTNDPKFTGPSVQYDSTSHIQVLCQMHASVWPRVIIFCILNTIWTAIIIICDVQFADDLSVRDSGHVFMSLMISFLIIARASNSLHRYMDARKYLSQLMIASRELTLHAIAFTRYGPNGPKGGDREQMEQGKKWRLNIAKRLITLVRSIAMTLQEPTTHKKVIEETKLLSLEERAAVELAVGNSNHRAPIVFNIFLRTAIATHVKMLQPPLDVVHELRLLSFTSDIMYAYSHILKDKDTPYPFPLVQMTRTFLFVWVFSLPLALANDIKEATPLLTVIFFLTYGFFGLELISIEMDDPYGDDHNDFDVKGLANVVYDDIRVYIYDIDGKDGAYQVENKIKGINESNKKKGTHNSGWKNKFRNSFCGKTVTKIRFFMTMKRPEHADKTSERVPLMGGVEEKGYSQRRHNKSNIPKPLKQNIPNTNSNQRDIKRRKRQISPHNMGDALQQTPKDESLRHGSSYMKKTYRGLSTIYDNSNKSLSLKPSASSELSYEEDTKPSPKSSIEAEDEDEGVESFPGSDTNQDDNDMLSDSNDEISEDDDDISYASISHLEMTHGVSMSLSEDSSAKVMVPRPNNFHLRKSSLTKSSSVLVAQSLRKDVDALSLKSLYEAYESQGNDSE